MAYAVPRKTKILQRKEEPHDEHYLYGILLQRAPLKLSETIQISWSEGSAINLLKNNTPISSSTYHKESHLISSRTFFRVQMTNKFIIIVSIALSQQNPNLSRTNHYYVKPILIMIIIITNGFHMQILFKGDKVYFYCS